MGKVLRYVGSNPLRQPGLAGASGSRQRQKAGSGEETRHHSHFLLPADKARKLWSKVMANVELLLCLSLHPPLIPCCAASRPWTFLSLISGQTYAVDLHSLERGRTSLPARPRGPLAQQAGGVT